MLWQHLFIVFKVCGVLSSKEEFFLCIILKIDTATVRVRNLALRIEGQIQIVLSKFQFSHSS